MTIAGLATLIYGVLALLGGIMGYIKAKSRPSLISGLVSGMILMVATLLQSQGIAWGLILGRVVTGLLIGVFIVRLVKTRKFMPAGLMVMVGVIALVLMFSG